MIDDLEGAAKRIEASDDYRVLRHIGMPEPDCFAGDPSWPTCVVLDTETTGFDADTCGVVELGLLAFRFDPETGAISAPSAAYSGLNDPGHPIPPEMTAVHGIADEDVAGRTIDREAAADILNGAAMITAHKARFDRAFVDKLGLGIDGIPWTCSMSEIDWQGRGLDGTALHPLLMQTGRFARSHRAPADCRALHALLGLRLRDRPPPMLDLIAASRRRDVDVYAENAGYAYKDQLRDRGYRWNDGANGKPKAWYRTMASIEEADAEEILLKREMLPPNMQRPLFREIRDATMRFRNQKSNWA